MSEYVFRYASGYGCNMSALMDGGRVTVGEYFASDATDHYGTLHEEIVRCRDCKHRYTCGSFMFCEFRRPDAPVNADGYCSDGERRSDAE